MEENSNHLQILSQVEVFSHHLQREWIMKLMCPWTSTTQEGSKYKMENCPQNTMAKVFLTSI